jgi:hypothetical protein
MSLLRGEDRVFTLIDGNVLTSGGSLNLANGQLAVIDLSLPNTQNGRRVVNAFDGKPADTNFEIKVGVPPLSLSRTSSDKPYSTLPFKLSEIVDLKVYAPKKAGIKTDEFIIGYNGKAGTGIVVKEGASDVIDVTLTGDAIALLGYQDGQATVKLYLEYPYVREDGTCIDCEGTVPSMQEIIEKAIIRFKNMKLMGGVPITDFIEILPVNSLSPSLAGIAGEVPYKTFTLTVTDDGDFTALGKVQAQYNGYKVVVQERLADTATVYAIIAPSATVLTAYSQSTPSYIKGCASCTAGYTEAVKGFVYSISIEDEGADLTTTIDDVPNFVTGSVIKQAQNGSIGIYSVVTSIALSEAQIATYKANTPIKNTSVFTFVGEASAVCINGTTTTIAWVSGETCNAFPSTYTITLADDECGANKLTKIQAQYPNLVISAGASVLCQTTYTTTVLSDIVCEECSDAFRDLFIATAPSDYERTPWSTAAKTYDPSAEMGIKIKGKPFVLAGSEEYRDDMPFYATSTRIGLAGGYTTFTSESLIAGSGRFAVKLLSLAEEPQGFGGALRDVEERGRRYFDGTDRLVGNNYGKWVLGQETKLKATSQYVDYVLTVNVKTPIQNLGASDERIYYHFYVEVGKHANLELLLNKLASAAGKASVKAYSA